MLQGFVAGQVPLQAQLQRQQTREQELLLRVAELERQLSSQSRTNQGANRSALLLCN